VVKEERRLRVENTPFGKFTEVFTETAFPDQPYGRPIIGYRILVQQRLVSSLFVVPLAEPPCFCLN
jgi:predicted Zn-dependent peptidase